MILKRTFVKTFVYFYNVFKGLTAFTVSLDFGTHTILEIKLREFFESSARVISLHPIIHLVYFIGIN